MSVDVTVVLLTEEQFKKLDAEAAYWHGDSWYSNSPIDSNFDFGDTRDNIPNTETRILDELKLLVGKRASEVLVRLLTLHSFVRPFSSRERIEEYVVSHPDVKVYVWAE